MSITLEQAKALKYRDILHSEVNRNAKGECQRWRVNGKVKRWKRQPDKIEVPVKYGMYGYDYLRNGDLDLVHLEAECLRRRE